MSEINICHCGQQAGYQHMPTCPYPLFHDEPKAVKAWHLAEKRKAEILKLLEGQDRFQPAENQ